MASVYAFACMLDSEVGTELLSASVARGFMERAFLKRKGEIGKKS